MPLAFAGEADVDCGHWPCAGPGLSAHGVGAGGDDRAGRWIGDAGADAHQIDGLVGTIGPLVDVVAGLELAGVWLGENVDSLQPLDGGDGVPVGHDEPERGTVVGGQWFAVHLVGDQDLRFRIGCVLERERTHEGQVFAVGLRQDGLEVVRRRGRRLRREPRRRPPRAAPARGRRAGGRPSSGRWRRRSRPRARRPAGAASRVVRFRRTRA